MLTQEQNDLLTRVGPGTKMGNLMRRYWQPIAASSEMADRWTHRVRLLGEDLVLFKDLKGNLGLVEESCPHRRASLGFGIPESDGIRCPYHGWKFDGSGRCLEQPFETGRNALIGKKAIAAYPVQELGGLIFAYLGPQPAPLLPNFSAFIWKDAIRTVGKFVIPCNWLQCMENTADPVHTEWLHGALHEFRMEHTGEKTKVKQQHDKIAFDEFEFGMIKRRLYRGQAETAHDWTVGHPLVFPNILLTGSDGGITGSDGGIWKAHTFQIRVPVDDTHTLHFWYQSYVPPEGSDVPPHLLTQTPPHYDVPIMLPNGEFNLDMVDAQDIMAWVTQGPIADRTRENLGNSDLGIVTYRRMLMREMEKVERGEDPIGVLRDPAKNSEVRLPLEKGKDMYKDGFERIISRLAIYQSPVAQDLVRLSKPKQKEAASDRAPAE